MSYSKAVGDLRMASKSVKFNPDTKAPDFVEGSAEFPCRFCGGPMFVYKEVGNFVWHSCTTEDCFGNKDTIRPEVSNREYTETISKIGDKEKIWKEFQPRQVI